MLSDGALLAAPILAIAAAAASHVVPLRRPQVPAISGLLVPDGQGAVEAVPDSKAAGIAAPLGDFWLGGEVVALGWPLVSGEQISDLVVNSRLSRVKQSPEVDAAIREAVARMLRREVGSGMARALERAAPQRTRSGAGLLGNVFLWWIGLSLLLPPLVQALRLGAWLVLAPMHLRRQRLVRTGRCGHCGFDLRGSLWSTNCPECGALLE